MIVGGGLLFLGDAMNDDFWNNVTKGDGCWEWKGARNKDGYGIYSGTLAHRVAYELTYGKPDNNVCHTCDNPSCCKPQHLFDGTQKENIQDAISKGRFRFVDPNSILGSKNGKSKLTEKEVVNMRAAYEAGGVTQQDLADMYHISRSNVANILSKNGKRWDWLRVSRETQEINHG